MKKIFNSIVKWFIKLSFAWTGVICMLCAAIISLLFTPSWWAGNEDPAYKIAAGIVCVIMSPFFIRLFFHYNEDIKKEEADGSNEYSFSPA